MSSAKYIIFPDANVLLDLYRKFDERWTKVAEELHRVETALLITQQVVDEVARQRFQVVRDSLSVAIREVKAPPANLPPGLRGHEDALRTACASVTAVRKDLDEAAQSHLSKVAESEDQVTLALGDLLSRPTAPTDEQLGRARQRKERGNPPGKPRDPLGDQVSWEQLLDEVGKSTEVIWLITRDNDFTVTDLTKRRSLNPFLKAEVVARAPSARVRLCQHLADAVNEYLAEVGQEGAFSKAEIEYFAIDDESVRRPWECLRDLAPTPIKSLVCTQCGASEWGGCGEEVYAVEERQNGLQITPSPDDDRSGPIECAACGGIVFEVEFASLCSYCEHVASKD